MSIERLRKVMAIQSKTYDTQRMDDFIYARYQEISKGNEKEFDYYYKNGNSYITKGHAESYPCVIAHTDTVHDIAKDLTVFDDEDSMFAMDMTKGLQIGIGGDDKVGIYIALEMLREFSTIKVAFFRDEEHGCLGSREADMSFFKDVEFVIQCDRQGYKDIVNTIFGNRLFDKAFSLAIREISNRYNKKETSDGGLTDVYQLVENGLQVCVMNLSCGYYRPHCDNEIIILQDVYDTRDYVYEIITALTGKIWVNALYSTYASRYDHSYANTKPKKKKKGNWKKQAENWNDVADRHGVIIDRDLRTFDDFDDLDAMEHMDLELACGWCGGDEIMYDKDEDKDWCFSCQDYSNTYNHYKDSYIVQDEVDQLPTETEEDESLDSWIDSQGLNSLSKVDMT